MMDGRIHSIESCGTLDGPGIRYVIFMQGCPLRCKFCHNIDTWSIDSGHNKSIKELMEDIKSYRPYMDFSGGGVTVSGGEPLLQLPFLTELFKECKAAEIHTAIDTSGYVELSPELDELIELTDLFLLDIKHTDDKLHKALTGVSNNKTFNFALHLDRLVKKMWIRRVVINNLTDDPLEIEALASFVKTLNNVERVELLPYHSLGEYKWEAMGNASPLNSSHTPKKEKLEELMNIFKQKGIAAIY